MTSSIRRSETGLRARLAVLLSLVLFFASAHLVLEAAAHFAESRLDAYLWKRQDYLRVFSPTYHLDRGHDRLWIYGPSEAREGLLPEEIKHAIPELTPYQNAQSVGTLEDGLIALEYIERAYGRSAIPQAILLGITPRFIGDIRRRSSPLQDGINKYSPHFTVVRGTHPPALVPRSMIESLQARLTLMSLQPDRYRRGVFAIASRVATSLVPALAANKWSWVPVSAAKYLEGRYASMEATKIWLEVPGNVWEAVHAWDPEKDSDRVTHELQVLLNFVDSHGIELYVVNLPELSWNRKLFEPGRYEAYLRIVEDVLGDTPFLNLRTYLPDDDFFDDAHPTWPAAIRVSAEVGAFIRTHRENLAAGGRRR